MIAALYVETNGCYFNLPGVDPWDITRDARTYAGPHPVAMSVMGSIRRCELRQVGWRA